MFKLNKILKNDNLGFEFIEKEYYLNISNIKYITRFETIHEQHYAITYDNNNLQITLNSYENIFLRSVTFEYNINNNIIEKYINFTENNEIENIKYFLNNEYIMNNEELNKHINNNKITIKKLNKLEFLYIVFTINNDIEKLNKISEKLIINKL